MAWSVNRIGGRLVGSLKMVEKSWRRRRILGFVGGERELSRVLAVEIWREKN
jgi:hypothetical protein